MLLLSGVPGCQKKPEVATESTLPDLLEEHTKTYAKLLEQETREALAKLPKHVPDRSEAVLPEPHLSEKLASGAARPDFDDQTAGPTTSGQTGASPENSEIPHTEPLHTDTLLSEKKAQTDPGDFLSRALVSLQANNRPGEHGQANKKGGFESVQRDLETAIALLDSEPADENRFRYLQRAALMFHLIGENERSVLLARKALKAAGRIKVPVLNAEAVLTILEMFILFENTREALTAAALLDPLIEEHFRQTELVVGREEPPGGNMEETREKAEGEKKENGESGKNNEWAAILERRDKAMRRIAKNQAWSGPLEEAWDTIERITDPAIRDLAIGDIIEMLLGTNQQEEATAWLEEIRDEALKQSTRLKIETVDKAGE
ncbi:MAG TPA: hypothetical protein DEB39_03080 [Planctomycetaceae bacterium]|nr:hypothetical protein [Planctomycetaceae bacterium]